MPRVTAVEPCVEAWDAWPGVQRNAAPPLGWFLAALAERYAAHSLTLGEACAFYTRRNARIGAQVDE